MPTANLLLLSCLGLTLLGIVVTAVAWRRGSRGRVVQGLALTLAPVGLYLSGLLGLLWNGIAAVGSWAAALAMSRAVWLGLAVLAACLVLWVVGGIVARRSPRTSRRPAVTSGTKASAATTTTTTTTKAASKQPTPVDDDLAEIEALLKSRGID